MEETLQNGVNDLSDEVNSLGDQYNTLSNTIEYVLSMCNETNDKIDKSLKEIDQSIKKVNDLETMYESLQEFVMRSGRIQIAQMFGVDFSQDHNISEISEHISNVLNEERDKIIKTSEMLQQLNPHITHSHDYIERKALSIPVEKEQRHFRISEQEI